MRLGRQLRTIRTDGRLTLQELARRAGVSQSLISQVERGIASPSITTLRRLAAALDVPIAALFVEHDQAEGSAEELDGKRIIVRSGERKGLRVHRSRVEYELLTPDLNREIEFLWIEYAPRSRTHPAPMSHPGEENAVCIEGSVVVTIEGREYVLGPGDSISFDSGRSHQVENRSDERAVLISAITPPSF
ncbi:cupin domain-containing protein [Conexibacter sp. JD483]|uniref:cupin domain-containing protein n=1 Tax=unclassified Conexibacter TaxID=2627773 RepID=UPI0027244B7F|nr:MULTISPECIES: cupin domain-containing protein [unclassified Conexibacter]MDO8187671.1 cupin domain-containing protein [Conexibacter sp. CPCC 205706]MDO8199856.1 cupin domain-containing protein [Conexibacter sp. CPCC 205762]MDR9370233.1 cupin domain-containing protein [Conexibacter sp. JD483]